MVTHDHSDHCKLVTINRIACKDTIIVAPERCGKKIGKEIRVIECGEEIAIENISIKAVEAYNTEQGSSTHKVHPRGNGVGYLVTVEGKTIYHAGDTDLIPEMKELGHIDVALLPIGGTYTMDINEAAEAAIAINPQFVIPMHRLKRADPHEIKKNVEARSGIEVLPLQIGEVFHLA